MGPQSEKSSPNELSRLDVVKMAAPLVVANATTPLLGLVDTAVLGHGGSATDLAAIALGALLFNFLYWSLGFLRMTTTGFVAQAHGKGDGLEVTAAVLRAVLLGLVAGGLMILTRDLLIDVATRILSGGESVENSVRAYFYARIGGAPGALVSYGALGALIGLGRIKALLFLQLATNGLNMALDVLFVVGLGWGIRGVALGTAIAEWAGALLALIVVLRSLGIRDFSGLWRRTMHGADVRRTLSANSDVLLRTLAMIAGFCYFADQGARQGQTILAANHLLLQFVSFSAFFLDGYAHVAESLVGAAIGARDRQAFTGAVRRTSEVALVSGLVLAGLVLSAGPTALYLLTDLMKVRHVAQQYLPQTALYVACSVVAFQLDGIFIGAVEARRMRNTAFLSLFVFIALAQILVPRFENHGLWWAFVGYVCIRGVSLGCLLPRVIERIPSFSQVTPSVE